MPRHVAARRLPLIRPRNERHRTPRLIQREEGRLTRIARHERHTEGARAWLDGIGERSSLGSDVPALREITRLVAPEPVEHKDVTAQQHQRAAVSHALVQPVCRRLIGPIHPAGGATG